MEDAIDKTHISREEVRIKAVDLAKTRKVSTKAYARTGFFCPICREPVQYIYSEVMAPYFKHLRNSARAKTCDRYSQSIGTGFSSTKGVSSLFVGNSLYIKKEGDSFSFLMGLSELTKEALETDGHIMVSVMNDDDNPIQYPALVSRICLRPNETSYLRLKTVLGSFKLKYSEKPKFLEKIWKERTFGISEDGGLFAVGSGYCRHIPSNENIFSEIEYYLVISEDIDLSSKEFLKVIETFPLSDVAPKDGFDDWLVHKVVFTEITQEAWDFAQDLQVNLISKEDTLTALWPPSILERSQLIFPNYVLKAHFLLNSSKETTNCKLLTSKGFETPVEASPCNAGYLLDVNVTNKSVSLSVSGKHSPDDLNIISDSSFYDHKYSEPSLEIYYGNSLIETNVTDVYYVSKADFQFKSNARCNIYLIQNEKISNIFWDRTELNLSSDAIKLESYLEIRHGTRILRRFIFTKNAGNSNQKMISGDHLLDKLNSDPGIRTVATPAAFRYILFRTKGNAEASKKLKRYILKGGIPKKTADNMSQFFDLKEENKSDENEL